MKALILNSGIGRRMGSLTDNQPKCMTELLCGETILSRQLCAVQKAGIREVVITTGPFDEVMRKYIASLNLDLAISFVKNPLYNQTNYIYSIYLARQEVRDDLLLMHGDLVFEDGILDEILALPQSSMTVSTSLPLPEKDFKAVIDGRRVKKIGIEFFENAVTAQPMYALKKKDWKIWEEEIDAFCQRGDVSCYAENAFNQVAEYCELLFLDVKYRLCN